MRPSLRQLSYLIAIKEHGSFLAAADDCAVTQSTLSAGIKELETILGRPLVNRNRKAATLTPFGYEVFEKAQKILEDTDRIVARSKLLNEPLSGPLRLGIIPTIAPYMLPDILPQLTENFPRLELQLHEDLTDRLLESLRKNELDLALMAFPYDTNGMTQRILFEEKFYAAIPDLSPSPSLGEGWGGGETLNINDLKPDELLLLEDGHCLRDHALSACDIQLPRTRKTFSATSLPTLIQMVKAGFGMTLLPEMACQINTLPAGIRLMPFTDKRPPMRQIGLCWRDRDPSGRDYEILAKSIL